VLPASVPPRVVELSIRCPRYDVQPAFSPAAGGHRPDKRNRQFGLVARRAQRLELPPSLTLAGSVEHVSTVTAREDVEPAGAPAAGRGVSRERRGDGDCG
jgi:hypothetical protein